MTYFNPRLPSELWVDASPVGVSGILIQNGKIVFYGSRALSPTEQRSSQTEREALACVFGCEHFHLYLFGKEFTLITDHAPRESIFNNMKSIHNARLERFRLKLHTVSRSNTEKALTWSRIIVLDIHTNHVQLQILLKLL